MIHCAGSGGVARGLARPPANFPHPSGMCAAPALRVVAGLALRGRSLAARATPVSRFETIPSTVDYQWAGFGVEIPRFRVMISGFGVTPPDFGVTIPGFRVTPPGFGVTLPGFRAVISGFGVASSRFRVMTPGFRVALSGFGVIARGCGGYFALRSGYSGFRPVSPGVNSKATDYGAVEAAFPKKRKAGQADTQIR